MNGTFINPTIYVYVIDIYTNASNDSKMYLHTLHSAHSSIYKIFIHLTVSMSLCLCVCVCGKNYKIQDFDNDFYSDAHMQFSPDFTEYVYIQNSDTIHLMSRGKCEFFFLNSNAYTHTLYGMAHAMLL